VKVVIVDVERDDVKVRTMELPDRRAGEPLLLPDESSGVLRAIEYDALELKDRCGRSCWIYVRA
jgi:hypothetical protein